MEYRSIFTIRSVTTTVVIASTAATASRALTASFPAGDPLSSSPDTRRGVTGKPRDQGLSVFPIAEGAGATAIGYSIFERTNGRANRSLSCNYSDGVIRTWFYWKGATLTPGQKTFFAQHFRAVPGKNSTAVSIEEIVPGVYAVETGADRSTVGVGDGIVFSSTRGTLALPAGANADKGYCPPNKIYAFRRCRRERNGIFSNTRVWHPGH